MTPKPQRLMYATAECVRADIVNRYYCTLLFGVGATTQCAVINTLRPRQNGRHFPGDIFKWIFLNENVWISLKIPLTFVPKGPINNIPALVQIMAWRRPGDKPLSEPILVFVPTHKCVTRPQWVKSTWIKMLLVVLIPHATVAGYIGGPTVNLPVDLRQ